MKFLSKTFLIAALVFVSQLSVQAQVGFGGRIGANLANFTGDDVDADSKIGIDIAVVLNIPASGNFSVQPELHYLQKGAKAEDPFAGDDIKTTLNYLQIPILGKLTFGEEGATGFYILGGPSVGLGLGYRISSGGNAITGGFDDLLINSFDFGVDLGAGVIIPLESGQVFVDIRYLLGIANINDDGDGSLRNQGINLGVGYITNIGG